MMGVAGTAVAFLLSASVALADDGRANARNENSNGKDYRAVASSTAARIQELRDEAATRVKNKREEAEKRLTDIRDRAKQEMAKKIAKQFDNLNTTWTDKFTKLLERYDELLQKVQDRATLAGSAGKDIASTTAAIQSAKSAIASARAAVTAQAAKTYVLDPSVIPTTATTTQSGQEKIIKNLRTAFQTLHSTLFKDLFALRDGLMRDARRAVQNAVQTLGKIPKVDDDNATSTESSNE